MEPTKGGSLNNSFFINRKKLAGQDKVLLFKGLSIHINGYTDPPSSELRRLLLQHGGDYQHYCNYLICLFSSHFIFMLPFFFCLVSKSSVTHIIATNLTNSKIKEFRYYHTSHPLTVNV